MFFMVFQAHHSINLHDRVGGKEVHHIEAATTIRMPASRLKLHWRKSFWAFLSVPLLFTWVEEHHGGSRVITAFASKDHLPLWYSEARLFWAQIHLHPLKDLFPMYNKQ